ncbi:MAG: A24 family peptidase C-terminal domain-containing protein [Halobacteria archaeon]|nr:A24 family peptidase C-terminal domain-containing protein [Halobacteria archaeon]
MVLADVLRVVVVVPVFFYASYRDILERRVRDHVWYPLVVVGVLALVIDLLNTPDPQSLLIFAALNLGIGVLFGSVFYYGLGTFGGADMKALIVISLLFPIYPVFVGVPVLDYIPVILPRTDLFVLSVLGNTVIVGAFYPLSLLFENVTERNFTNPLLMFVGKRVRVENLHRHYGRLLREPYSVISLLRSSFSSPSGYSRSNNDTTGITDLDFIRDYVDWLGVDNVKEVDSFSLDEFVDQTEWGSDDIEKDEEALKNLVEYLEERDEVWISPGIPFIVPMTIGLILALTVGDLLFMFLRLFFSP